MNYKAKLKDITTFIFDVDGVLTDGKVYLLKEEVVRALNSKDGYALQYASKNNYDIFIITGGYSEDLKKRLIDLGIKDVFLRSSKKIDVYNGIKEKYSIEDKQVLYMGDDIPDIPVLKIAGVSCCPQDAAIDVKEIVDYHSPLDGGKGCVREIIEQAAIVYDSKKSAILELGGGVPKNTAQQTGPLLDQILKRNDGGQEYIIQITDARPDTGGLSGATLQEGKSWGKIQDSHEGIITVYADATIAFPILALYVLSNQKSREPKRLYKKIGEMYNKLSKDYFKNPDNN